MQSNMSGIYALVHKSLPQSSFSTGGFTSSLSSYGIWSHTYASADEASQFTSHAKNWCHVPAIS